MNIELVVSTESFSADPVKPVFAVAGDRRKLARAELFTDTLEFKTPDNLPHTIIKGHIYIFDNYSYECLDDLPKRETFAIRLALQLPPLDVAALDAWHMAHAA